MACHAGFGRPLDGVGDVGVECSDTVALFLQQFGSVVQWAHVPVKEMAVKSGFVPKLGVDGVWGRVDEEPNSFDLMIVLRPFLLRQTRLAGSWQCVI